MNTGKKKKSKIDQIKDIKIWDSTQIYNSGRISGATDKGICNIPRFYQILGEIFCFCFAWNDWNFTEI
jgi:hypothetical protein